MCFFKKVKLKLSCGAVSAPARLSAGGSTCAGPGVGCCGHVVARGLSV